MKPARAGIKIDLKNLLDKNLSGHEIVFSESSSEEEVFHQKDLILLDVFGLTLNSDHQHPLLILKDQSQRYTLSVLINPLEAGVTLTQSNKSIAPTTPHRFAHELLGSLGIEIQQCVFVQIKGSHQFVRVYFKGHPKVNSLKLRADEVMSLVLHLNVPIFASQKFIEKSKVLSAQIAGLVENMSPQKNLIPHKNQAYVI